jgi:hypothetical protein
MARRDISLRRGNLGGIGGIAAIEQAAPVKFGIIKGIPERTEKWHHTPDV